MKIGILTLPLSDNYGGILQAIALYRILHNKNYEVVLISKEFYPDFFKELVKKLFLYIPFIDLKDVKANNKQENLRKKRKNFHRSFIENEIFKISKPLYTKKELEKYIEEENINAVVVGSDQVWRKQYINDKYYKSYFLNFINNKQVKRISYAASFGKNYWEGKDDLVDISTCLKEFDAISTREFSGIDICKNSFGIDNVKHVLDPTLLIGKEFYLNEIILKYKPSNALKGGIVTYVLDEADEKKEIINFMQNSINIKKIDHLKGFNNSKDLYTVPEWLSSFENADFIITDSFHGMIFSIIFEKNFLIIGNENRGLDRFLSFLNLVGLEDRLVFNINDIKNKKFVNINYDNVNKILDLNKKISIDFLINNLNNQGTL